MNKWTLALTDEDVIVQEDDGSKLKYFRRENLVSTDREFKSYKMRLVIGSPYIFVVGPDFVMNYELKNKQSKEKSFGDLIKYVSRDIETNLKYRADMARL